MKICKYIIIFTLLFTLFSCGYKENTNTPPLNHNKTDTMHTLKNGDIIAVLKTNYGTLKIKLHTKKVPFTTANFIGLSQKGYYDKGIFHRIIKDFMIQGGDPEKTGRGGESIYGKIFDDEFHKDLKNIKYSIAMANAGPNTNGSQFFINGVDNNFLDGKHTVFGQIVEGTNNVNKIITVKTNEQDKPEKDVNIISIEIKEYQDGKLKNYKLNVNEKIKEMDEIKKQKSEAKKRLVIQTGSHVSLHYTGKFLNGEKFDSSFDRKKPLTFEVGAGKMIKGLEKEVIGMKIGEKKNITLKPKDAYGEYDKSKTQTIPKEQLKSFVDAGIKLEKGAKLPTQAGVFEILNTTKNNVIIDVNHPLAGKTLIFDIEIIDII